MKKYLIKFGIVLIFLAFLLGGVEWYARVHDDSGLRKRRDYFYTHANSLDGIIFGPSFLVQGLNPAGLGGHVASLALAASAPDVDTKLFYQALEHAEPDFVVMDLTVGTLERRKTANYYSLRKLYYYYGICYDGWKLKDAFYTSYPLYRYFFRPANKTGLTEQGFPTIIPPRRDKFKQLEYNPDSIALHRELLDRILEQSMTNNEHYAANVKDLHRVVATCQQLGIKLIFIDAPKYVTGNNAIPKFHYERRTQFLKGVVDNETVYFKDFSKLVEDEPHYFHNMNHLNPTGAAKFTEHLNRYLRTVLQN